MPLILDGTAPAAAIRTAARERAAQVEERTGRQATLAAVAIDAGPDVPLFFDVKERAFADCGALFQRHVLPAGTTTREMIACIRRLNDDAGVDAIFVQYPLPENIDAQAAYDAIAPSRDVDAASSIRTSETRFVPATAEAVLHLLEHHAIAMRDRSVCIIRGDPLFARDLAALFTARGAMPGIVELHDGTLHGSVQTADIVVAVTGVVNGVSAASFRDGAVAVDVGYYHGGGRGDILAHPDDVVRMSAYATPRGSIGPLTVAILIDHTIAAAEHHA